VTDSLEEAQAFAKETFEAKAQGEKDMYDKVQEAKRAEEEANMPDDMGDMGGMGDMDMGDMGDYDDMDMDGMGDEF